MALAVASVLAATLFATLASSQVTPASASARAGSATWKSPDDPGLPPVVGSVNGEIVTGRVIGEVESFFARETGQLVGTPSQRRKAWRLVVRQFVEEQTARRLGLYPSIAAATQATVASGLQATDAHVQAVRAAMGIRALEAQFLTSEGVTNDQTAAWEAYVTLLVRRSAVQLYVKRWDRGRLRGPLGGAPARLRSGASPVR